MSDTRITLRSRLNYLTYLAVLITFAVVIHTVEAALPLPMPVPGVRLGLANIITLLTLVLFGLKSGLLVSMTRSVLGSIFVGGLFGFGFWLSFSAGIVSCLAMAMVLQLQKRGLVSLISVSVIGAATHNITQLALASVIIANATLFTGYYPFLLLLSVPTGLFTGLAAYYLEGVTRRMIKQSGTGVFK
ncbi:MAG: Gx transporter family protein [Dethiobacteria bacterium]|nr:Gx transporter family protein [Bacillota bacterium]MDW7728444.1 Gx transporter family protein [Bacillota bacterium]